jgi:acetyl-CoA acetyltransferase
MRATEEYQKGIYHIVQYDRTISRSRTNAAWAVAAQFMQQPIVLEIEDQPRLCLTVASRLLHFDCGQSMAKLSLTLGHASQDGHPRILPVAALYWRCGTRRSE